MAFLTKIAFRVDASTTIGTGHLKRCLSLAQAFTGFGVKTLFVCRPLDNVATQILARADVSVRWLLPVKADFEPSVSAPPHAAWAGVSQIEDAGETACALANWLPDWLVVDHYAFDARWHRTVREALNCRLLVIDDTADRALDADVLLDQNFSPDHRAKYEGCIQREPIWLCGPRFALLSPAYQQASRYCFHDLVRSIGIFMGGTDPSGISARVLDACRVAGFKGDIEVVSTTANPYLFELRNSCLRDGQAVLTIDLPDLALFFARHDLQIGAGGGSTWERCYMGVPTVVLTMAANQSAVIPGLVRLGAVYAADESLLADVLRKLIADSATRRSLSECAAGLVDGRGTQRVALALLCDRLELRAATTNDACLLHGWRNHHSVRAASTTQTSITFEAHQHWLASVLKNPERWLFVAQVGELPVGSIRFDQLGGSYFEVSLYIDPELKGLGLGQHVLAAGERNMLSLYPGGFTIDAQVLPTNTASQHLFQAAGYHGGPLHYQKAVKPRPIQEHNAP